MNLKSFISPLILLFFFETGCCQNKQLGKQHIKDKNTLATDSVVYLANHVDQAARLSVGDTLLQTLLLLNFHMPKEMRVPNGTRIEYCFIIEKEGKITHYPSNKLTRVLLERELIDSMISSINKLPPFIPAVKTNKRVRSSYCISTVICSNAIKFVTGSPQVLHNEQVVIDYVSPCPIDTDEIYTVTDQPPEFVGGNDSLLNFINMHLVYPQNAKDAGIEGRVTISFVIEKDGSISQVKVIKRLGWGCDEEAVRLVSKFQYFKPGVRHNKPVRTLYTLPITFKIRN